MTLLTAVTPARDALLENVPTGYWLKKSGEIRKTSNCFAYIGNYGGFVRGGLLLFESKSTKDYHEDKDGDVFNNYLIRD